MKPFGRHTRVTCFESSAANFGVAIDVQPPAAVGGTISARITRGGVGNVPLGL